jgi:hypothetical protein
MLVGRGWIPPDEIPNFVGHALDARTTHGICERCMHRLEQDGASRPLRR